MTVTPERRGELPKLAEQMEAEARGTQLVDRNFTVAGSLLMNGARAVSSLLSALDEMESRRIASERERAAQIAEACTDCTTEASARKIATRIREAP